MDIPNITPLPRAPSRADGQEAFNQYADPFIAAMPPMVVQINAATTWVGQQGTIIDGYRKSAEASAGAADQARSAAVVAKDAAQAAVTAAGAAGAAQVELAAAQVVLATAQAKLATTNGAAQVQLAAQQAQLATTNGEAQVAQAATIKNQTATIRDQTQVLADAVQTAAGLPSYADKKGWVLTAKEDGSGVEWRPRSRVGETMVVAGVMDATWLPLTGGLYLQSAYPTLFAKIGILGVIAGDTWAAYSTTVGGAALRGNIRVGKDNVMLGAGGGGSSVYRSTDGGLTWITINLASVLGSVGHSISSIETDRKGVWVCTAYYSTGTIFGARSIDNGLTWVAIPATQIPSGLWRTMATDGNGVWVIGSNQDALRRSSDNGITWSVAYSSGGSTTLYGLVTDRQGNWLVARASVGILKSVDNGINWVSSGARPNNTPYDAATDERGMWVFVGTAPSGATAPGLYVTRDHGLTWTLVSVTGSTVNGDSLWSVTTDRVGNWYVGASNGKVIRSIDNGQSWQQINTDKTGFASNAVIESLWLLNNDLYALGNYLIRKAAAVAPYDSNTLFKLPEVITTKGLTAFIKAKEVA